MSHWRGAAMFLIGSAAFTVLALLAHRNAYFPIDLAITRALQSHESPLLTGVMYVVSWPGFLPQVIFVGVAVTAGFFLAGFRWEALALAFAGSGGVLVTVIKLIVQRPRPSVDLVRVLNQLSDASFPSGHVVQFTAFGGFLIYLATTRLARSSLRTALIAVLGLFIALVGPSRIYLGQHWFSDVLAAYVLGALWLVLTIRFYRFRRQSVK